MGKRKAMTGYACYRVCYGGYVVQIHKLIAEGTFDAIDEYWGGDSWRDSGIFNTGEVPFFTLSKWARETAREMLKEHGLVGPVYYDKEMVS